MEPTRNLESGRVIAQMSMNAVEPKLPETRRQILDVLRDFGPMTSNEVVSHLPPSDLSNNNARSRLKELVESRVVVINAVVKDPISGRLARQYRALMPGETPPPVAEQLQARRASRTQLEAEIVHLRAENEALKSKLDGAGKRKAGGASASKGDGSV